MRRKIKSKVQRHFGAVRKSKRRKKAVTAAVIFLFDAIKSIKIDLIDFIMEILELLNKTLIINLTKSNTSF